MVRPDLVVGAMFIAFVVLVLSGVHWACVRSLAKSKITTQNISGEWKNGEISTTRSSVMENTTTQSLVTKSELSSARSPAMGTSIAQSFLTEIYPILRNPTGNSSTNRSTEIHATERSTTKQPMTRQSFNNSGNRIFLNQTDLVTDSTFSTGSPGVLSPKTQNPKIHTTRYQTGLKNVIETQIKERDETHSMNTGRNSNLTRGEELFLHTTNCSNLVISNTERIGRLEHRTNRGPSEKLKTLNESVGFTSMLPIFTNVSLHLKPGSHSPVTPLNKSTVDEDLEKENHTTIVTVPIFESVTAPKSVEPSVVGVNSSIVGGLVGFGVGQNYNSSQTTNSKDDDVDYVKMGQELVMEATTLLDTGIWDFERRTEDGDVIFSRTLDNGNAIYRLTGIVDMPPQDLLVIIYDGLADYPKWNPTLLECRVLEKINDQTDISYTVSAPGARGYVASRDFVSLRHWDVYQNTYVAATKSIDFQNAPSNPDYIRGQNGAGCMELRPLSSDPFKTEFRWLLNTRLNGWIPSYIADKAYKKFMTKYMVFLREYCKKVKQRAAEALTPNAGNITTPPA